MPTLDDNIVLYGGGGHDDFEPGDGKDIFIGGVQPPPGAAPNLQAASNDGSEVSDADLIIGGDDSDMLFGGPGIGKLSPMQVFC